MVVGLAVKCYGSSDKGMIRSGNEDKFLILESEDASDFKTSKAHMFVVADGMGGHLAGEVAAEIVCEVFGESWKNEWPAEDQDRLEILDRWIREANKRIYEKGISDPMNCANMGSTVSTLLIEGDNAWIGHVGDSRIYRLRDSVLEQITEDHTEVAFMVKLGRISPEEARTHPRRPILLKCLGDEELKDIYTRQEKIEPGDRYLVCSDGVNEMIEDKDIGSILSSDKDPKRAVERLIEVANDMGGKDNITAIVVDVDDIGGI